MSRPNVLVLMSDQQRLDTVGAYRLNPTVRTPHIDSLAARGIRFEGAFTPTAICSPARASLLTGLYPHKHGVTANGLTVREGVRTLPDYLGEAGYRCGYAGKWHVDQERGPTDFGFAGKDFLGYAFPGSGLLPGLQYAAKPLTEPNHYEVYLREGGFDIPTVSHRYVGTNPSNQAQEMFALHGGPVESSIPYFVAEEANRVIDEISSDGEPFFAWVNFWGPHTPCLVPEPYFSMYDPDAVPEHPSYCETFEGKPYRQQLIERLWGLGDYGWRGFQEISARYYGYCTLIDDMVGRILAHLQERGLSHNTVVVYTADHGDCLGAHRLIEKGEFMYDEIYRIPLVVAHPECQAPGTAQDDFVYLHEIACSVLDLAGIEVPAEMDGRSFLPAIRGEEHAWDRDEVFCIFNRHFTIANQRMVRTRTHQLTFNSSDPGELYDLTADPYQLRNVYGRPEYEDVRVDLMGRMEQYLRELGDPVYGWFRRISGAY